MHHLVRGVNIKEADRLLGSLLFSELLVQSFFEGLQYFSARTAKADQNVVLLWNIHIITVYMLSIICFLHSSFFGDIDIVHYFLYSSALTIKWNRNPPKFHYQEGMYGNRICSTLICMPQGIRPGHKRCIYSAKGLWTFLQSILPLSY